MDWSYVERVMGSSNKHISRVNTFTKKLSSSYESTGRRNAVVCSGIYYFVIFVCLHLYRRILYTLSPIYRTSFLSLGCDSKSSTCVVYITRAFAI